ncbi:hypothetical protein PYCC9005_001734 [Savitreella phatthalungensis]
MPDLAKHYWVIAPDMKGYGATYSISAPDAEYGALGYTSQDTMSEFFSLTRILLQEARKSKVRCVIGHDMGGNIAGMLAQLRPDIFESLVVMSHPFTGATDPLNEVENAAKKDALSNFAALIPPRKHYQWYFSETTTARELLDARPIDLRHFYRGYYWFKSAHCPQNTPHVLSSRWSATAMAALPEYYVMPQQSTMPEAVAANTPSYDVMLKDMGAWMDDDEIEIYLEHFKDKGFQGGLNQYLARTSGADTASMAWMVGMKIKVPMTFISGAADWGNYQSPGSMASMETMVAQHDLWRGTHLIDGAGHWCQQERPTETIRTIRAFLASLPQSVS